MEQKKLERIQRRCLEELDEAWSNGRITLPVETVLEMVNAIHSSQWVPRSERLPTRADADCYGHVDIWVESGQERRTISWGGFADYECHCRVEITHWMTPPAGPKEEAP